MPDVGDARRLLQMRARRVISGIKPDEASFRGYDIRSAW
jgi:hypothetical protein